jgi:predicted alpha/beta hydrolase
VLSFDLRGHGKSRPTPREGGSYRYDDFVAHDIPTLLAFARATHPELPVGWIGHSLGAHTALVASGLRPAQAPDALVLLGANIWMPRLEPSRWRRAAKSAVLSSWLAASRRGYFDPRPFRLGNETVSRGFIEQFSRFWRRDRFASWDDGTDYLAALNGVRTSVLSIASDGDVLLAHPVCVARFVGHACNARLERRVVPHASHMGLATDARSRPVWEQIADWLRARLSS